MKFVKFRWLMIASFVAGSGLWLQSNLQAQDRSILPTRNDSGIAATFSTTGSFDFNNPFFKSLGTNGRSCVTCHQPNEGWGVSAAGVQSRFKESKGQDPIFRRVDGANCPAAVGSKASIYSLLLSKALIRIDRPLPDGAEFSITVASDPYGCSSPTDISVYRRPLPSTNLKFLSAVMWDGRETAKGKTIQEDFLQQAIDATLGHAQAATAPDAATVNAIRAFETSIFTAQVFDKKAGLLFDDGATGGPIALSQQDFFLGINDPLGGNPSGAAFDPAIFNLFNAWAATDRDRDRDRGDHEDTRERRAAVVRGQTLFNSLPIPITGVAGLNDNLGVAVIPGTCGTCHDSPNAGNHSLSVPLNIGLADASRRTPDLPLFTLKNNATGEMVQTSDPGRAMVSGKWADIGKFKGPVLRGLAARAPYFHNGSAATLLDAMNFYNDRFNLNLTGEQKADLVAFLKTL
jgi:cytochrome c peroxidase